MKVLVVGSAILAILYFIFVHSNPFKQSFTFGDDYYSHNRSQGGGDFENHFYTIGGEDVAGMRQLVQILELPENTLPEQYEYYMTPLFSRYKLEPYKDSALERVGNFEQAGLKFKSFSTTIEIDDRTHMIFYLTNLDERRGRPQVLRELADIRFE